MIILQVEKRDGQLEDFDREKITRSVTAAGLAEEEVESLASEVEVWANEAAKDDVVSSSELKGKVLELLRGRDPGAATRFEEYKKEY